MSGIVLGTGLAGWSNWWIFALAILTTLSLQILSNLSNELGDALKGTDADQKGREAYGLQAGTITVKQMKTMIWCFVGLCVLFGTALVFTAFGIPIINHHSSITNVLLFLGLGLLAIIGAVTYTLGKHSYGYMGLGDLGVFLFFGLLSTMGAYYLQVQAMNWEVFWCGAAIGMPCVGVLNLNNIRDMQNDIVHGKRTFASWLGPKGARVYHFLLLSGCLAIFMVYGHYWVGAVVPIWAWHIHYVGTHVEKLDKQMPVLMFSTLLVAILALF
jgi:1,4-dihydroxy-2-naphthoate octaprenyltransferase